MPLLSVIMSSYHSVDTIRGAVRSTLFSMPRDSELVVTIDGPDQPTVDVLAKIHDKRLKVFEDPENKGLSRQLVAMTDRTDSKYLARMDSDDYSLPWRFASSMPALRTHDFVFTPGFRFGTGTSLAPSYPVPLNSYETSLSLLFFNPLFHPSMVCRREALVDIGGYLPIRYGEDNELWLRAAGAGKRLTKTGPPSICYRLSPGQMSAASGVEERLLASPEFRSSYLSLASRFGIADRIDDAMHVHVDADLTERLLQPVKVVNRKYLHRQIVTSALTHLDQG